MYNYVKIEKMEDRYEKIVVAEVTGKWTKLKKKQERIF